jgi:hypothetical protein
MSSARSRSGGKVDREHVEPVQQVLAQLARLHRFQRVAVGRRDHAHVGLQHLRGAHAHEGARLQHAQQLDLQVQRHLGDLVQEQRASARALEKALVLAVRAREAALLVAEDLRLDQVRRDRPAVDRQERLGAPARQVVHRARDHLLAAAALARDEHRHRRARHAQDLLVHAAHARRLAPQQPEVALLLQTRLQAVGLGSAASTAWSRATGCRAAAYVSGLTR